MAWDWLEERKRMARMAKNQVEPAMASNSAIMPVGERYNVGASQPNDTGYGEDGRLQTDMPVAKFNTAQGPRMVHEGEQMRPAGNGDTQVVSQAQLLEEEKMKNTPGYKCGGKMKGYEQGGVMPGPIAKPGMSVNPIAKPGPNFTGQAAKPEAITPLPVQKAKPGPNFTGQAVTPEAQKSIPQLGVYNTEPNTKPKLATGAKDFTGQTVTPDAIKNVSGLKPDAAKDSKGVSVATQPQKPQDDGTSPYEQQFQDAIGRIGQLDSYNAERQKWLDQQGSTQATEELVQRQRSAQRGIGGVEAQTLDLMQQRMHGQESAGAYADTAIGAMALSEQAQMQKAQLALQGMSFEQAKEQWTKEFGLSEEQWNKQFGLGKDQWEKQFGLGKQQWEQQFGLGKEQWQKQFDFATEQYGDGIGGKIADLVNQGVSLEQLQKQFPDQNITAEQYKQMQDWSPTGVNKDQWDYSKKIDSFNQLTQMGGEENFKQAAEMFNDMFGTDIDFSNALTEENKQKFNDSWNNMSGSIASGMSFDEWKKVAEADGTFDDLNMTESDIESMYNNMQMQSNPIYQAMQQYDMMLENGDISQEDYDKIMDTLNFGLTNPEGFDYSTSYQVLDADGNEVKNFQTPEEAQAFMDENPDQGYGINEKEDGWISYSGSQTGPDGTGDDPDLGSIEGATSYLEGLDVYSDTARIQQYLDEHGGKMPEGFTADDWNEWDQATGSYSRVNEAMSGGGLANLTRSDRDMIEKAKEAQYRIAKGEGTDEDKALMGKFHFEFQSEMPEGWNFENPTDVNHSYGNGGYGKHNSGIYDGKTNTFQPEIKKYFEENKGKMFEYKGQFYRIEDIETRELSEPGSVPPQRGDALKVTNANGETEYLQFGFEFMGVPL